MNIPQIPRWLELAFLGALMLYWCGSFLLMLFGYHPNRIDIITSFFVTSLLTIKWFIEALD